MMEEKRILRRLSKLKSLLPAGTTVEGLIGKAKERETKMADYIPEISRAEYRPERTYGGIAETASIYVSTKSGSLAELSRFDWEGPTGKDFREDYGDKPIVQRIKPPVFWFNRLLAARGYEGKGDGRLIMVTLEKLLDDHGITVINGVNPYGGLDRKKLTKFYEKYGFVLVEKTIMVREPRPVSKEA